MPERINAADFLTCIDGKIIDLVEAKTTDQQLSSSISYFNERLKPKFPVQVLLDLKRELTVNGIPVRRAAEWLLSQG